MNRWIEIWQLWFGGVVLVAGDGEPAAALGGGSPEGGQSEAMWLGFEGFC